MTLFFWLLFGIPVASIIGLTVCLLTLLNIYMKERKR